MAKPFKRRDSKFWWLAPWIQGKQVRQSSGETDYDRALRKLKILEGKIASNAPITAKTDRDSFAALLELVITDYKVKGRASAEDTQRRIAKHLAPALGHLRAGKISAGAISQYILSRQEEGAANGSINRELAIIKRAFRLGIWNGDVSAMPRIELLPEDNARQGFFVEDQFRSVLKYANPMLRDVLIVAYYTGWRIDSVLHLEWSNVDLKGGVIRLRVNQTKNRKAAAFPLQPFPELRATLEYLAVATTAPAGKKEMIPSRMPTLTYWVFHRNGERCISIRKAWEIARAKANVPGRLIHDLRRTAVRRLLQMGFPTHMIKSMVGFKTDSMLHRYSIVTEQDVLEFASGMSKPENVILGG